MIVEYTKEQLKDFAKYPYIGICGNCYSYNEKLTQDCLCPFCKNVGIRRIGKLSDNN